MSRFERYPQPAPPKKTRAWDGADVFLVLGIISIVVGVGSLSIAAALILAGLVLGGLATLWAPTKK